MSEIKVNNIQSLEGTHGPVVSGITTMASSGAMTLPRGDTSYRGGRGRGIIAGGGDADNFIDYITIATAGDAKDFGDLTEGRRTLGGLASSTRGLFGGGNTHPTIVNTIDYITISATGNAFDFGDLTQRRRIKGTGASDQTRGIWAGGYNWPGAASPGTVRTIDYVTIASKGDASFFGELSDQLPIGVAGMSAAASPTRAIFGGGSSTPVRINIIEYITLSTLGDAQDFGDLTEVRRDTATCSSTTRGLFMGGRNDPPTSNIIDYVTIASLGDAIDFGDLTDGVFAATGLSNSIRGIFAGGNNIPTVLDDIEFVTIATLGNAADFGNLVNSNEQLGSCSDSHGGLG